MTGARHLADQPDAPRAGLRVGALGFRLLRHGGDDLPPVLPDRAALAGAIDDALRGTLDPSDPSYWVIRHLGVRFRADAALGVAHLAAAFAQKLQDQVRRVLAGEIVEGVRRYESRAHWLADCLVALAQGSAAGHWQFGRYRDHAGLPGGEAVRLTILQEPDVAMDALSLMAEDGRIRPFGDRIGEVAARGILRAVLPRGAGVATSLPQNLHRLLATERSVTPHRRYGPALIAVALSARLDPDAPLPRFATLDRVTRPGTPLGGASDVAAPVPFAADDMPQAAGDRPDHAGRDLTQGGEPPRASAMARRQTTSTAPALLTGFAGVFVLWRSVLEMDLLSLLPEGEDAGPARLALAATLSGPHHEAAWCDPALHWLCGHEPAEDEVMPPPPRGLMQRFVNHYTALRYPHPVRPTLTRIGRIHLLQDAQTEDWLTLGAARSCHATARRLGAGVTAPDKGVRDPATDLHWFGAAHRRARRPWVVLARAAYGDFARRLNGLQGASAAWSWDKLLAGWGTLEQGASEQGTSELGTAARMALPRVPLDLVLRMGALDGAVIATAGGPVELRLPGAG